MPLCHGVVPQPWRQHMSIATAGHLLSDVERSAYDEQGSVTVPAVFPPGELPAAVSDAERLVQRKDLIDVRNLRCRWQPRCEDGECLFETFDPVIDLSPACAHLARHPRLLSILGELY